MSSSRTIEPSSSASTSLPEGELTGYYVRNSLLYRVSQGDREIVLDTPIPEAKPPIDSNIRDPDFREHRYISYQYPYLIFVPKYYAWRDPVFKVLDCSYSKIPIVGDRVGGFYLHPNVAEEMRDLENTAWFFPARFKFLQRSSPRKRRASQYGAQYKIFYRFSGQFKFSRYTIGYDGALRRDPYSPPPIPVAPAGPATPGSKTLQPKNYPARAHTLTRLHHPSSAFAQQAKEKREHFVVFHRRKGENEAKMAKESPSDPATTQFAPSSCSDRRRAVQSLRFLLGGEDGHYIRRPGGRGTYAQLWQEYPAPQRRFDPISNEWDLCELFENNDPCWGGAVTHHHQDDDEDEDEDDDYAMYPTLDVTLSTLVPREDDTIDY
ncbi:hypothetical protein C8R43DRAFT_1134450 [Mycena crocata]|nr:hypothetical protein C8R43DRAFT_1134450 [Mycena crocata]